MSTTEIEIPSLDELQKNVASVKAYSEREVELLLVRANKCLAPLARSIDSIVEAYSSRRSICDFIGVPYDRPHDLLRLAILNYLSP
jgi:hypothetical protein